MKHDNINLIYTVLAGLLLAAICWIAAFVWSIDNEVQELKANQRMLIKPSGEIRPSIDVEILKVEFKKVEKRLDKLECKDKKL